METSGGREFHEPADDGGELMPTFDGTPSVVLDNVLTTAQAANFLRTETTDAVMLQFLPLVDQYLLSATGHNWAADVTKHSTAITAAGMLLIHWYDNPTLVGQAPSAVTNLLVQLEAEALKYRKSQFYGSSGAGSISISGSRKGDDVISLVGVYGVTGDQSSKFESAVSVDGQIQQTDSADLSDNVYVVVLKHPADDVSA